MDILNHIKKLNPKVKFLLENVRMKKEYLNVFSDCLGVQPVLIDSNLISAQDRRRYYWCNWNVQQPSDRGVVLGDIIFTGRNNDFIKYQLSDKALARYQRKKYSKPKVMPEKAGTLNTKNNSGQLSMDSGTVLIPFNDSYRRPTPVECERLQTVPDNYTNHVSETQRYRMLGNGWTVDVIAHILDCANLGG